MSAGFIHKGALTSQTEVIREYCSAANKIEIHNHYRRGILAIEVDDRTNMENSESGGSELQVGRRQIC